MNGIDGSRKGTKLGIDLFFEPTTYGNVQRDDVIIIEDPVEAPLVYQPSTSRPDSYYLLSDSDHQGYTSHFSEEARSMNLTQRAFKFYNETVKDDTILGTSPLLRVDDYKADDYLNKVFGKNGIGSKNKAYFFSNWEQLKESLTESVLEALRDKNANGAIAQRLTGSLQFLSSLQNSNELFAVQSPNYIATKARNLGKLIRKVNTDLGSLTFGLDTRLTKQELDDSSVYSLYLTRDILKESLDFINNGAYRLNGGDQSYRDYLLNEDSDGHEGSNGLPVITLV